MGKRILGAAVKQAVLFYFNGKKAREIVDEINANPNINESISYATVRRIIQILEGNDTAVHISNQLRTEVNEVLAELKKADDSSELSASQIPQVDLPTRYEITIRVTDMTLEEIQKEFLENKKYDVKRIVKW